VVTGGGLPAQVVLPDQLGGWVRSPERIFSADDYPSLQALVDACLQRFWLATKLRQDKPN